MSRNRSRKPYADKKDAQVSQADKPVSSNNNNGKPRNNRGGKFSPYNDIKWYTKNPSLTQATARIPFPYRPGMKLPFSVLRHDSGSVLTRSDFKIPGVMAIRYVPTPGYSDDVTSAASIAGRELYANIRKHYSADLDADGPDLIMYLFALDNLHAYLEHCKRVYGLTNKYTGDNYSFPDLALNACGFNAAGRNDLRKRHTELWGRINNLILNANKFALPDSFHLFSRHQWMNHTIYMDMPSVSGQAYIFVPAAYFYVKEDSDFGTSLLCSEIASTDLNGVDDLLAPAEAMVKTLSEWGDAYTIDGYMRRVFEKQRWVASDLLDQNYVVEPSHSEEVLNQIENLKVVWHYSYAPIKQNPATNAIIYTPTFDMMGKGSTWDEYEVAPYLNIHHDIPTETDVVEASRLCVAAGGSKLNYSIGTEVVVGLHAFVAEDTEAIVLSTQAVWFTGDATGALSELVRLTRNIVYRTWWQRAPILGLIENTTFTTITAESVKLVGDLDNVGMLTVDDLRMIHHVCVLSEFNCFSDR